MARSRRSPPMRPGSSCARERGSRARFRWATLSKAILERWWCASTWDLKRPSGLCPSRRPPPLARPFLTRAPRRTQRLAEVAAHGIEEGLGHRADVLVAMVDEPELAINLF